MIEHAEKLAEALEDLLATEQALRHVASTVDSTEQVKFYLLRVADEIARVLAKRKP